ncbi:hypothetical protein C1645_814231 [Glomus cerebriforme]|uniref:Uncharacterized protein n=1 Tax=Glomus cerebriforme TaxID=658196 RepID=A0A397TQM7_9GLOM|nr:hypothetical protein C1645_814231 [Glomus cerebriforme]
MEENLNKLLENPNDIKRTTNKREKTSINISYKKEYKTGGSTKNCMKKITKKHNESHSLKLIYELDSKFDMPDSKNIKAMIHIAYNYTFKALADLYTYISKNIKNSIEEILGKWNLQSKVYFITISVKSMDGIEWHACVLHTPKQTKKLEDVQKSLNKGNNNEIAKCGGIVFIMCEWNLIQNLVDVLEPFAKATDYLGGSSYCTYSIINPVIEEIKGRLTRYSLQLSSPPLLPLPVTDEELLCDKVEELKLEGHSDSQSPLNSNHSNFIKPKSRVKYKNSVFTKFQKSGPMAIDDKVQEYLKLDEIDWKENPFTWWAHNEKEYHGTKKD